MDTTKPRKRWNEEYAKRTLKQAQQSGLGDEAFAAREGFDAQRLAFWRRRLKGKNGSVARRKPRFVEVSGGQSDRIEIKFANGRVVYAPLSVAPERLRALLDVVEG